MVQEGFIIACSPKQAADARGRLIGVAALTKLNVPVGFGEVAPRLLETITRLPDLRPLLGLAVELRGACVHALVDAGAVVPRVTWAALGLAHLFEPQKVEDNARLWCLSSSEAELRAIGCVVEDNAVHWPAEYQIGPFPFTLARVARARG